MFRTTIMKQMLKPCIAIVFLCILQNIAWPTTYYVDSMQGNDENKGTHAHMAWQTLGKINATTFLPGDEIRFRADSIWFGVLKPRGSGSKGHPIIIDRYGNGELPVLNGEGLVTNVVHLHNQSYWEIRNLEITNYLQGDTKLRRGVYIGATDYGTLRHIHLVNLIIHDINGDLKTKDNGGIFYEITGHSTPTRFDDFLIEGCHIYDIDRTGISNRSSWETRTLTTNTNWYPSTNVVIRDNVIVNDGGNVFRISGQTTNTHIYNNTIYLGSSMSTRVIWHKSWKAWPDETRYDNNIFYNLGKGNYDFGFSTGNVFSHNVFYGNHPSAEPSDPHKSTSNPRFVDPDSRGILFSTGAGFQLQANSPCIDLGQAIPGNGALDYWGNPVSYSNTATDRGAHEYTE